MDDFYEVEGGGMEHAEDRVFVCLPMVGQVQMMVPDDVEGQKDAQDDQTGMQ